MRGKIKLQILSDKIEEKLLYDSIYSGLWVGKRYLNHCTTVSGFTHYLDGRILEITMEKTKEIENQVQQANTESYQPTIIVKPVGKVMQNKNYKSLAHVVAQGTTDTTYILTGATKEFINSIDRNRYRVGAIVESMNYPGLYDVNYINKK